MIFISLQYWWNANIFYLIINITIMFMFFSLMPGPVYVCVILIFKSIQNLPLIVLKKPTFNHKNSVSLYYGTFSLAARNKRIIFIIFYCDVKGFLSIIFYTGSPLKWKRLVSHLQVWRFLCGRLVCLDVKDAFCSSLLIYNFRIFERRFGTRKFAVSIRVCRWTQRVHI